MICWVVQYLSYDTARKQEKKNGQKHKTHDHCPAPRKGDHFFCALYGNLSTKDKTTIIAAKIPKGTTSRPQHLIRSDETIHQSLATAHMKNILILTISWAVSSFRPTIIPRSPHSVKATNNIINKWAKELFSVSSTTTDVEETAQRDIASMDDWASACGVERCQGFQLVATNEENEHLDVGAMTTVDLPAESPVLFVPRHIIISADQAKNEIGYIEAAENIFYKLGTIDHTPYFYLFLKILIEYELGEESLWYPWLNSLPRYFSTGASMTHFCCQDCLPPLVGNLAMSERTRFRQFFKSISYCDLISQYTKADKKLAKWAFNIVYTRGFEDGYGDVKIVPFGDYVSSIDPYLSRSREKIADSFRHIFFVSLSSIMTQIGKFKGNMTTKGTIMRTQHMMFLLGRH